MNRLCSGCGHEAVQGETFTVTVNTNTEWWKNLFDLPQYCDNCRTVIKELNCKRCNHTWHPRQPEVTTCPKCKSPYWDRERR